MGPKESAKLSRAFYLISRNAAPEQALLSNKKEALPSSIDPKDREKENSLWKCS